MVRGFVATHTTADTTLYTDEAQTYDGIGNHEAVKHSVHEYVRGEVHTNGIESFWSMLKRGYIGVFHRMSPEHLHRYVGEFEGRHNARDLNTTDQMTAMVRGGEGRLLRLLRPDRQRLPTPGTSDLIFHAQHDPVSGRHAAR